MKKLLIGLVAVLAVAASASAAGNLLTNGRFDDGMNGWTSSGVNLINGDFGLPASPSGNPVAGVISSWGGDWNGPVGSISQTVFLTGTETLSGELYAAAHAGDLWRNVGVEVLWNGAVVASLFRDASPMWAGDFPWVTFSTPVTGTGANELKVQYTIHFAEWSWTAADNLHITPEPAAALLLGLPLLLVRRRRA